MPVFKFTLATALAASLGDPSHRWWYQLMTLRARSSFPSARTGYGGNVGPALEIATLHDMEDAT